MLLQNQAWVRWVMVLGGNQPLAVQADQGIPSLVLVACSLLACQGCIQGWLSCQDQWRDIHRQGLLPSYLVAVPVDSLQAGLENPLPVEDNLLPVEESHHQPVMDNLLAVEDSHLVEEGSHLVEEGSHLVEEDKLQLGGDKPQAVVGILPEGGIQGSSCFSPFAVSS